MAKRDWYCEDVLSGKLAVQRVFEDDRVLAFHHPKPVAKIHVVVVPKSHVPSLLDEAALDGALLSSMIRAVQATASKLGLTDGEGFYVRANAAAPGVTPHMHWHVLALAPVPIGRAYDSLVLRCLPFWSISQPAPARSGRFLLRPLAGWSNGP